MRTNRNGVTENSEFNINLDTYGANLERIYGVNKKVCGWCGDTGNQPNGEKCPRGCEPVTGKEDDSTKKEDN